MAVVELQIKGDEWWLKPDHQPEHETREEWKARTFSMHYGRRARKFSPGVVVRPEIQNGGEAQEAYRKFQASYPEWIKLNGEGI